MIVNTYKIIEFSIGKPKDLYDRGMAFHSGIGKKIVEKAFLTKDGFIGDGVANATFHGGPDRAVCVYPYEHYDAWETKYGSKLPLPAFGENLTAEGMKEEDIFIGDIFKVGSAIVQVTQGRVPCFTINQYTKFDGILKDLFQTALTGYFFRVLEEGEIKNGDKIISLEKNSNGISVLEATKLLFKKEYKPELFAKLMNLDPFAEAAKKDLHKMWVSTFK
jgi:MOSC domain-containing protein YiiM